MKHNLKTTILLILLFLTSQLFGLFIVNNSFNRYGLNNYTNDERISNSLITFPLYLIILTFIFLFLIKLKINNLIKLWYSIAIISTIMMSLSGWINLIYSFFCALGLLIIKFDKEDDYFHNIIELLIYGGLTLSILPLFSKYSIIILLVIISVYDFIAVRLSKHMIILAKSTLKLNIFSGFKVNKAILGGGDIAFPMIFSAIMLRDFGLITSLFSVLGSTLGLTFLLFNSDKKKFYPAMPFLTTGAFLMILLNFYLF